MSKRALIACASFKGTLSSLQAGRAIAQGFRDRKYQSEVVALADGGEGLVEALARAVPGARRYSVKCRGPLKEARRASFAILPKGKGRPRKTAVIEMAASSGLPLVPSGKRDPKKTTTLGVGDQLKSALDRGAKEVLLGIGGSATNDGGAGMAQALGARLLDARGRELPAGGAALLGLDRIDISGLDRRLERINVIVACDVNNPLCGTRGASAVFGPQKGATPSDVKLLDRALSRFARIVRRDLGMDVRRRPGAGAAGGLGAGCVAFLGAALKPGIELVLDALAFDALLKGKDLVVTGEGMLDRQTLMGKAPAGVASRASAAGIPCVAIGGGVETRSKRSLSRVFAKSADLSAYAGSTREAMERGSVWLRRLARESADAWFQAGT